MANLNCFKTRPIGEIFYVEQEKVFLKVVLDDEEFETPTCRGCYFYHYSKETGKAMVSCVDLDIIGACGNNIRDDEKPVHFVKVEPQMELEPCPGCHKDNCNECIVFNQYRLEQEKIISKEKSLEEQVSFLVGLLTERQLDEFTSFLNK